MIAATHEVVDGPWILNAKFAGHTGRLLKSPLFLNSKYALKICDSAGLTPFGLRIGLEGVAHPIDDVAEVERREQ